MRSGKAQRLVVSVGLEDLGAEWHDANGAVDFENREPGFLRQIQTVLTQRLTKLLVRNALMPQIGLKDLSVIDQENRVANHGALNLLGSLNEDSKQTVHDQERRRRDQTADKRVVVVHHRVLNSVAQHDDQHEIEQVHLPKFALPDQAQAAHQEHIDHNSLRDYRERAPNIGRMVENLEDPVLHRTLIT